MWYPQELKKINTSLCSSLNLFVLSLCKLLATTDCGDGDWEANAPAGLSVSLQRTLKG